VTTRRIFVGLYPVERLAAGVYRMRVRSNDAHVAHIRNQMDRTKLWSLVIRDRATDEVVQPSSLWASLRDAVKAARRRLEDAANAA
jgi:hypothetical protein